MKTLLLLTLAIGMMGCGNNTLDCQYLVFNKGNSIYPIYADSVKMISTKEIIIYKKGLTQRLLTNTQFVVVSNN
jgi:hypothetical protein